MDSTPQVLTEVKEAMEFKAAMEATAASNKALEDLSLDSGDHSLDTEPNPAMAASSQATEASLKASSLDRQALLLKEGSEVQGLTKSPK